MMKDMNNTLNIRSCIRVVILIIFAALNSLESLGQIENVFVETYYISDANDATDTTGGRIVEEGSVTYRVFVDLAPGSRLKAIYGDQYHPLIIASTDTFYNNNDRPTANFGYLINKGWFKNNPTLALDSWITLGLGEKTSKGVLKTDDTDSTFVGGDNNNGGTASISGGILVNNDSAAGLPLTQVDGLVPTTQVLGQWLDDGIKNFQGNDTTIFGPDSLGMVFHRDDVLLKQNAGVIGADSVENIVLIGQFTTKGELTFSLNLEVDVWDGISYNTVYYVADDDTLLTGEQVSPFLTYPPLCGCTDPNYLEYNPSYACNIQDSCLTQIVYGCLDTAACNYDPNANFNINELCCYPGYCNDRDLTIVCPDLNNGRAVEYKIYPNPVSDVLNYQLNVGARKDVMIEVYDVFGRLVLSNSLGVVSEVINDYLNVSSFGVGMYFMKVYSGENVETMTFVKE